MGQYYKGTKIGTCESMYYMRLSEAKKLARQGQADDDGIKFTEYLEDNVTRFRFPFPDEDQAEVTNTIYQLDHVRSVSLPAEAISRSIDHDTITVANQDSDRKNVNIFIPCPNSLDFNLKSSLVPEVKLSILFQAIRDGKEKTIFACNRCGQQQRFSDEDIQTLKKYAMECFQYMDTTGKNEGYQGDQERYEFMCEVINRIK